MNTAGQPSLPVKEMMTNDSDLPRMDEFYHEPHSTMK